MCVTASYASRVSGAAAVAFSLLLSSGSWESLGVESNAAPAAASQPEETNSPEPLRAYLQLQEDLRATQLAIEQNRQETKEAAAQNAEALSKGLQAIQQAFAAQRAQDLEAMQRSNKVMLIVVGIFGAMGLLIMLIMICFQWRMSKGLAEISIVLPTALELGPGFAAPMLPQAPPSDSRLLGATDRPEPRTHEQEPSLQPAPRRRERTGKSIESRIFPGGGDSFRRKQFRALRVAVIVGLICAAVLAVLFYVVTTRKWGFN